MIRHGTSNQLAAISIVGWSRVCCLAYPFGGAGEDTLQILLTNMVQSTWVTILGNCQYPTADLSQFAYLNSMWYNDYSTVVTTEYCASFAFQWKLN